ncbi:MAG: haloacid dehalogenase type II [Gemmobacter sp.]
MTIRAVVFDAYGTLFDVASAARHAFADDPAMQAVWPRLAEDWRRKQLEYTWLRAIMGRHADFRQVTADALDWALAAQGVSADRDRLMALYDTCEAYPEVPAMLSALDAAGLPAAILSNGSPAMLSGAIAAAGLQGAIAAVISVEEAGVFKPDARVYALVEPRLGLAPADVLFVSSNGWDACGAALFGFETVWINRSGAPPDRLPAAPARTLAGLADLPVFIRGRDADLHDH